MNPNIRPRPSWDQGAFLGLFGFHPVHDYYQNVVDWISKKVASSPDVEIESRLGVITLREGDTDAELSRFTMPVATLCQVNREKLHTNVKFSPGVQFHVFAHFNQILNTWLQNSQTTPPERRHLYPEIKYIRTKEFDLYFSMEESDNKIRETRSAEPGKSGQVLKTIIKDSMGYIDFHSPKTDFDFRIGASIEKPVPAVPQGQLPDMIRKKDRLSYQFECFSIDITTTETWDNPTHEIFESVMEGETSYTGNRTHEVELEIFNTEFLRKQRAAYATKQRNCFYHLCSTFFNHSVHLCHVLSSKSAPTLCAPQKRKRERPKQIHPHQMPGHYRIAKKKRME